MKNAFSFTETALLVLKIFKFLYLSLSVYFSPLVNAEFFG